MNTHLDKLQNQISVNSSEGKVYVVVQNKQGTAVSHNLTQKEIRHLVKSLAGYMK